ncbi:hypothetical protein DFH09DRAFT_1316798 [Mycena vulgaris]|nr:hypothetical protein DFH09DRAFT_1316798 [Mycena vulgaris]
MLIAMRCSASLSLLLLVAAAARATPNFARQAIQCPPTDRAGSALTSSEGDGDLVTCIYGATAGAGPCSYFPANDSFLDSSSQCPIGIAQSPSVTTDAPSFVGAGSAPSTFPVTFTTHTEPVTFTTQTNPVTFTSRTDPVTFTSQTEPVTFTTAPASSIKPSLTSNAARAFTLGASNSAAAAQALVALAALVLGAFVL